MVDMDLYCLVWCILIVFLYSNCILVLSNEKLQKNQTIISSVKEIIFPPMYVCCLVDLSALH